MDNEKKVEEAIKDKGLTAPRLSPDDIDAVIISETYTALPSGKCMICEMTLMNGYTVRGEACSVSKENFDEEIGKLVSREDARGKVWQLEGYLLQERLFQDPNETFMDRVVKEANILGSKLKKLDAFFFTSASNNLDPEERRLLNEQLLAMVSYHRILGERIERFTDRKS